MSLKLLLGLGNMEPRYDMTRHNAGFSFIDEFATRNGAQLSNSKNMQAHIAKFKCGQHDLIIAKPTTYMNLSGKAAAAIMSFYKVDKSDLIVVHDEVALNLGVIRLARGGGSAGNHGIESIRDCIGTLEFNRLRIGVGPDPGGAVRADYVLSVIPQSDRELYFKVISTCIDAAELWIQSGIQEAMNKFNGINLDPNAVKPAKVASKSADTAGNSADAASKSVIDNDEPG